MSESHSQTNFLNTGFQADSDEETERLTGTIMEELRKIVWSNKKKAPDSFEGVQLDDVVQELFLELRNTTKASGDGEGVAGEVAGQDGSDAEEPRKRWNDRKHSTAARPSQCATSGSITPAAAKRCTSIPGFPGPDSGQLQPSEDLARAEQLLRLDDALRRLAQSDSEAAAVVELRLLRHPPAGPLRTGRAVRWPDQGTHLRGDRRTDRQVQGHGVQGLEPCPTLLAAGSRGPGRGGLAVILDNRTQEIRDLLFRLADLSDEQRRQQLDQTRQSRPDVAAAVAELLPAVDDLLERLPSAPDERRALLDQERGHRPLIVEAVEHLLYPPGEQATVLESLPSLLEEGPLPASRRRRRSACLEITRYSASWAGAAWGSSTKPARFPSSDSWPSR